LITSVIFVTEVITVFEWAGLPAYFRG